MICNPVLCPCITDANKNRPMQQTHTHRVYVICSDKQACAPVKWLVIFFLLHLEDVSRNLNWPSCIKCYWRKIPQLSTTQNLICGHYKNVSWTSNNGHETIINYLCVSYSISKILWKEILRHRKNYKEIPATMKLPKAHNFAKLVSKNNTVLANPEWSLTCISHYKLDVDLPDVD